MAGLLALEGRYPPHPCSVGTRLLPYLCVETGPCTRFGNATFSPPASLDSASFPANLRAQNIPAKKPASSPI